MNNAIQKDIKEASEQFVEKYIKPYVTEWDKAGRFPRSLHIQLGEAGLLGMLIPENYGGSDLDYHAYASALITVSKSCGSLGLTLAAHNSLVSQHLYQFGTERQKKKYLPGLSIGSLLGAWALTEPSAGSDAGNVSCRPEKKGDYWVLNGSKIFITQGASADLLIVLAKTGTGKNNLTAFIVRKGTLGFSAGQSLQKLGMRASETAELFFDNCIIPDENRIGEPGDGFRQTMYILEGGRISIAALSLGIAKGTYELALDYAREREQFGKKILDFQVTGFKFSGMATEIYAAELMLKEVCERKNRGQTIQKESAMCKLFASELAVKVSGHAVQILGGYGYMQDYRVEKHFRDAKLCTIGEGTSEIMKSIILKSLLSNPSEI